MAKLITVYWRDIPAQIIAKRGRATKRIRLSQRFQEAIDRAAMRAGKGSSNEYLDAWRREPASCDEDIDRAASEHAEALESKYSDSDLETLVKAGGIAN